jgi:regulator of protease activity HflC (stomatin/prohibitin superfamily)
MLDKMLDMGKKAILLTVIGVVGFFAFMSSMYTVNEGHVGVVKRFSEAVSQVDPGLHFKLPFVDSVDEIEIRTRKNVETMPVATKEQMRAQATVSTNWTVKKEFVLELYKKYGSLAQFEERILDPKLRTMTKEGIAKFTAEENINQREKVSALIYENFAKVVEEYPIVADTLQYEDLKLPEKYLKSIDDKQTAKNERDAEAFRLEKQAQVAQQAVNTANAERDAAKARADGQAYKIQKEAEAQAKAIQLKGEAEAKAIKAKATALKNNPLIVELTKAQNWNGALPTTMMGDGQGVLMDMRTK